MIDLLECRKEKALELLFRIAEQKRVTEQRKLLQPHSVVS